MALPGGGGMNGEPVWKFGQQTGKLVGLEKLEPGRMDHRQSKRIFRIKWRCPKYMGLYTYRRVVD